MIPAGLIVIVYVENYKSDPGLGINSMKSAFRTIATIALVVTGVNYTTAQAGFLHENSLVDADGNSTTNSTYQTAYDIGGLFDTEKFLFPDDPAKKEDGTPFIQDSSGDNISSSPHVQIVSAQGGQSSAPFRTATMDYFKFYANGGDFLTLDVDCGYVEDAVPCDEVVGSSLSQADIIINLLDPNGNLAATNGLSDFEDGDFDPPSYDYGSSINLDPFLEYEIPLLMQGLWVIEIGQFFGLADINPFFTDEGYLLNVTSMSVSAVPVPAALWLFGTALIGLIGVTRRKIQT